MILDKNLISHPCSFKILMLRRISDVAFILTFLLSISFSWNFSCIFPGGTLASMMTTVAPSAASEASPRVE